MKALPNIITFLRMPLALVYLQENVTLRCLALVLAGITDYLDGFFARRYRCTSAVGATLDPIADKCFFISILTILFAEHSLSGIQLIAMLSRDIAILCFTLYLVVTGTFSKWKVRTTWSGKIVTGMQFAVVCAVTLKVVIPSAVFYSFAILGCTAFIELYLARLALKAAD